LHAFELLSAFATRPVVFSYSSSICVVPMKLTLTNVCLKLKMCSVLLTD